MGLNTLFLGPNIEIYADMVSDPTFSRGNAAVFGYTDNIPCNYLNVQTYSLAAAASQNITIPTTALANTQMWFVKVVGQIHIVTTAKDYDGTTTIAGYLTCSGTSIFPGILLLNTYNVTSLSLVADLASTVEIYSSILS